MSAPAPQLETYRMPEFARPILGSKAGVPWDRSYRISSMNRFTGNNSAGQPRGLVKHSFQTWRRGEFIQAVMYETTKMDIDADGGKRRQGDTFQPDTALHDGIGRPLNADRYPFMVLPEARRTVTNLQEYGLRLGDLGLVVAKIGDGPVCVEPYIYGDIGPWWKVGECSTYLAKKIRVNPDPVRGGIHFLPPGSGIMHLAFPGSHENRKDGRTDYTEADIRQLVAQLYRSFTGHEIVL